MKQLLLAGAACAALFSAGAARADTVLFIDDTFGNIGQVDLTTHAVSGVHNTGNILTDIGFGTNGVLYGNTFTQLFSINTSTGAATLIGSIGGSGGMNALVGSGTPGNLLGASNATTEVYNVSQATGATTNFHASTLPSAGDLAFAGSVLYESAVNGGSDALVNVSSTSTVGNFHTTSQSSFSGVFGLADDGTTMYAVNGTEVYSVNLTNALLTPLFDYSGHGLFTANGTAFIGEGSTTPAPEPATLGLLSVGLIGLGLLRRRQTTRS